MRASVGGPPAPRRPAARTTIAICAPRSAGPQPRDDLRRARLRLLHEAVLSIAGPRGAASLRRRPVAAASRRFDQEHITLADRNANFLGLQDAGRAPARFEPVAMRQPVLAPEQAVRRVAHAIASGIGDRRLLDVD